MAYFCDLQKSNEIQVFAMNLGIAIISLIFLLKIVAGNTIGASFSPVKWSYS